MYVSIEKRGYKDSDLIINHQHNERDVKWMETFVVEEVECLLNLFFFLFFNSLFFSPALSHNFIFYSFIILLIFLTMIIYYSHWIRLYYHIQKRQLNAILKKRVYEERERGGGGRERKRAYTIQKEISVHCSCSLPHIIIIISYFFAACTLFIFFRLSLLYPKRMYEEKELKEREKKILSALK